MIFVGINGKAKIYLSKQISYIKVYNSATIKRNTAKVVKIDSELI